MSVTAENKLLQLAREHKENIRDHPKYFCFRCYSYNVYTRVRTRDFRCRKCGHLTNICDFDTVIKNLSVINTG